MRGRVSQNALNTVEPFVSREQIEVVAQNFGETKDCGERRPQLVRERCEEFVFDPVHGLEFARRFFGRFFSFHPIYKLNDLLRDRFKRLDDVDIALNRLAPQKLEKRDRLCRLPIGCGPTDRKPKRTPQLRLSRNLCAR